MLYVLKFYFLIAYLLHVKVLLVPIYNYYMPFLAFSAYFSAFFGIFECLFASFF
jgi:hypothetical protein